MKLTDKYPLPESLEIISELSASGAVGRAFKAMDGRSARESVLRIVRVIEMNGSGSRVRDKITERTNLLIRQSFPFVSCPRELYGSSEHLCVVEDFHAHTLAERIQLDEGIAADRAETLLEQLLIGLSGLHEAGIYHGELRPENIFLSEGDGGSFQIWIGNVAEGGLACWSHGEVVDGESRFYFPPEWNGLPREPCARGDLFALGVLMCEALLGRRGNPQRQSSKSIEEGLSGEQVQRQLARTDAAPAVKKLIHSLVSSEEPPFQNAADALRELRVLQRAVWKFRRPARAASLGLTLIAVCVLCLALAGYIVHARASFALQRQIEDREAEIVRLKGERAASDARGQQPDGELRDAKEEIKKLKEIIARNPPTPPSNSSVLQEAQDVWSSKILEKGAFDVRRADLVYEKQRKKEHDEGTPEGERPSSHLKEWRDKAARVSDDTKAWRNALDYPAAELKPAFQRPWEAGVFETAVTRARDLNDAARIWRDWSEDSSLTWDKLKWVVDNKRMSPGAREFLKGWLSSLEETNQWSFHPVLGTATVGSGTTRKLVLSGLPNQDKHDWGNETKHQYPAKQVFKFEWAPGSSISVSLDGEGTWYKGWYPPALVSETFHGPLALWKLNRVGRIASDEASLQFTIPNCPGPPPEWGKPPVNVGPAKQQAISTKNDLTPRSK